MLENAEETEYSIAHGWKIAKIFQNYCATTKETIMQLPDRRYLRDCPNRFGIRPVPSKKKPPLQGAEAVSFASRYQEGST